MDKILHETQVDLFLTEDEIPEEIRTLFRQHLASDLEPFINIKAIVQGWKGFEGFDESLDNEFWISESWIVVGTKDDIKINVPPGHPLHEAILDYRWIEIIEWAIETD